jgi:hypothetical protein
MSRLNSGKQYPMIYWKSSQVTISLSGVRKPLLQRCIIKLKSMWYPRK